MPKNTRTLAFMSSAIVLTAISPLNVTAQSNNSFSYEITPTLPSGPVRPGAVFFTKEFELDYLSGSVYLAGSQDGFDNTGVDDMVIITVTRPDNSTVTFTHNYSPGCMAVGTLPPTDISYLFLRGRNKLRVQLQDACGTVAGSNPLWFVGSFDTSW